MILEWICNDFTNFQKSRFFIKNDIKFDTCTCDHLGHVQTDLNGSWCHGSLMTVLPAHGLWSGNLTSTFKSTSKPVSVFMHLLADAVFPLWLVQTIALHHRIHRMCAIVQPAQRIWWKWCKSGSQLTLNHFFHDFCDVEFWGWMSNNIDD